MTDRSISDDLINSLPGMFYLYDDNGRLVRWNKRHEDALGYSAEELRGKHVLDFFEGEDRATIAAGVERVFADGRGEAEASIVTKDGRKIPYYFTGVLTVLDGRPHFLGLGIDISDRVGMETQLNRRAGAILRLHKYLLKLSRLDLPDSTAQIREILESDARALQTERVSLWYFNDDGTAIACKDLYALSRNSHQDGGTISAADCPRYFSALRESRVIAADNACEDPRTCEFASTYLGPLGITSMLDASVWLHGKIAGVVCHEHVGPLRNWLPEEQDFAASIADMVSLTLEAAERERAEDALSQSEKQFRDLIENVPIGIYRSTPEGKMLMANTTMVKMLGYASFDDLAARSLDSECEQHGYARATYRDRIEQKGRVVGLETIWRKSDGHLIHMRENARAVFDQGGQALYYEGTIEDITEQKWAEEALFQEAEFRRATVERAAEGLCVCHGIPEFPQVRFTVWNKRMTDITGYTLEEINTKGWYQSMYPDPAMQARAIERMSRMRLGEDIVGEEWEITRADGTRRVISISTSVLGTSDGKGHVLALMQDVTERKRTEQKLKDYQEHLEELVRGRTAELERANLRLQDEIAERTQLEADLIRAREAAEAANRAKSTFLANMSHGIRTPMNAILGYAQILHRDATLGAAQRDYVSVINRSGEHLLGLINEVLEMSKIEAGHTTFNPQEFDFHGLLGDLEAMFRARAAERNLVLRVTWAGAIPRYLYADSAKIREVLINLLGNAVKFTSRGSITVAIHSTASSDGGRDHTLAIDVEDTGCGVASDEIDRVFEPFEQARSGRYQAGGTGLGLPISREYARMMGGDLVVESSLDKGSVFRFTFKARVVDTIHAPPYGVEPVRQVVRLAGGRSPKILVVDDDEASREALSLHLSIVGFDIRQAHNGAEAVEAVDEWRPEAVLMDLWMPEMDGLEATRRIKASSAGGMTPVLTVTASILDESERDARAAGSDGFIRKPFRKAEVFAQLKRVLGVEYVYEADPCGSVADRPDAGQEPVDLPAALARDLADATECGDSVGLRRLLEEHRSALGSDLAGRLTDLVNHYEYDRIMEILGKQQVSGR